MSDPKVSRQSYRDIKAKRQEWSKIFSKASTTEKPGKEVWSLFDEIVCINLKERDDRYQHAKELFDSLGMPVKFHRVDRHPNGGVQGCYESHIQVITSAYERGLDNLLVFEDDVAIGKGLTERKIMEALSIAKTGAVNAVYLGWHPQVLSSRTQHAMGSVYAIRAYGTHAYIVTRKMMEVLANRPYDGTPIDVLLAQYPKTFGIYPTAFVQGMADSDITANFSNSKWMRPIRAGTEAWSVNVNMPPQYVLLSLVLAVIAIIMLYLLARKRGSKWTSSMYVVLFILIFVVSLTIMMSAGVKRR